MKLKWKVVIYKRLPIEEDKLEKIFESEPMSFEEYYEITPTLMKPSMFGNRKIFLVQGEGIYVKEN